MVEKGENPSLQGCKQTRKGKQWETMEAYELALCKNKVQDERSALCMSNRCQKREALYFLVGSLVLWRGIILGKVLQLNCVFISSNLKGFPDFIG
jgi:hypothetical protein